VKSGLSNLKSEILNPKSPISTPSHPLPKAWRWVRLGHIARVFAGSAAPQGSQYFSPNGTPFVRVSDLSKAKRTTCLLQVQDRLSPAALKTLSLVSAKKGTILLPKSGAAIATNNRAILGMDAYIVSHLLALEPKDDVTSLWLYWALCQIDITDYSDNPAYPSLKQTTAEKIEIPLPPLSDQKRIAATLKDQLAAVDKARAAAQARRETAEALPAACLRAVFDGPNAAKWPTKRLGEVLVPHKEIIHPGDRETGTATFVGLEHLESHTGRRIGSLLLDLARLTGRKPTFRRGQIVYGYLRPYLNKVWIAEFDGCSSVDQFAYEVRRELADVRFVAWFMRSPTYLRRSEVVTTTGQLPRIGTQQIAAVEIGLPSLDEQRAIADELDHRFATHQKLRDLLCEEADAIERIQAALLRQAFAGKQ